MLADLTTQTTSKPAPNIPAPRRTDEPPETIQTNRRPPTDGANLRLVPEFTPMGERPAAPSTPAPTPQVPYTPEQQAAIIRRAVMPALMAPILGFDSVINTAGCREFLAQLFETLVDPADPVERMMCEQLAFAHLRLGKLHSSAGMAESVEASRLANAASIRLMGEFRMMALALETYRAAVAQRRKSQKQDKRAPAVSGEEIDGAGKPKP